MHKSTGGGVCMGCLINVCVRGVGGLYSFDRYRCQLGNRADLEAWQCYCEGVENTCTCRQVALQSPIMGLEYLNKSKESI
jgi:hypothetical protein